MHALRHSYLAYLAAIAVNRYRLGTLDALSIGGSEPRPASESRLEEPEEALGNRTEAIAGHRGEPDPLTMARLAGSVRAGVGDFKRKAPCRGRRCRFRQRSRRALL
jgi:hypothetical protein